MASDTDQQPAPGVSAGFAGAGGGTLLAVIASNLPEGNPLKPWLIWIAPSVSVAFGAAWLWMQRFVASRSREREVTKLVTSGRATLNVLLADPNITQEHRNHLRSELEALNEITVSRMMDRIKQLHILGTEGPVTPIKPSPAVSE